MRHLQNYARKYTELYPHATQIILKCAPSFFWTSTRSQVERTYLRSGHTLTRRHSKPDYCLL